VEDRKKRAILIRKVKVTWCLVHGKIGRVVPFGDVMLEMEPMGFFLTNGSSCSMKTS